MDAPLAVRGDQVEHHARPLVALPAQRRLRFVEHEVIRPRLVGGQMLAPCQVVLVIQIEMLAAGQRAPGDQPLDVQRERGIGAALVDHPPTRWGS